MKFITLAGDLLERGDDEENCPECKKKGVRSPLIRIRIKGVYYDKCINKRCNYIKRCSRKAGYSHAMITHGQPVTISGPMMKKKPGRGVIKGSVIKIEGLDIKYLIKPGVSGGLKLVRGRIAGKDLGKFGRKGNGRGKL